MSSIAMRAVVPALGAGAALMIFADSTKNEVYPGPAIQIKRHVTDAAVVLTECEAKNDSHTTYTSRLTCALSLFRAGRSLRRGTCRANARSQARKLLILTKATD